MGTAAKSVAAFGQYTLQERLASCCSRSNMHSAFWRHRVHKPCISRNSSGTALFNSPGSISRTVIREISKGQVSLTLNCPECRPHLHTADVMLRHGAFPPV
jgi:hypothetical protein